MSDIKNTASLIDVLKLKASKYYQDEMEAMIGGKLFVEENELKQFHKTINLNINTKFRDEFNMLNQYTYVQTLRECIKVVFDKVVENNSLYRPKETHAIGIDLGTTNSCVSYFKPSAENKFNCVIVPNEGGKYTTSSVVSIRDDEEVVGDVAKDEIYLFPKNTIMSAKRLIGRKFKEKSVQKSLQLWSYDVFDEENYPKIRVKLDKEEKVYYPEQISAKVLKKMKDISGKHLGCEVTKAVITVPAYFSDSQKQATKDAAEIAGLEVMRIINEPTAAAIAFRLNWTYQTEPRNVLIYDFGGGTFDVAILTISEGEANVKAVGGDNHLGGDDFDTNIIEYCLEEFNKKYKTQFTGDEGERALSRLRLEAEKSKFKLSSTHKTKIMLMYFYESHDLNVVLTRDIFEKLNKDLIEKSMNLVLSTLKEAALTTNDIDDIVLVGGSTRIPKIQERLSEIFGGRSLNHTINPDEAVAVGAAIHAAMLNEKQSVPLGNFVLRDVNPHSLGIAIKDHRFHPIIRRNTKIPTKMAQEVQTTMENQVLLTLDIYEGEGEFIKDNNLLGKFTVTDVPEDKLGVQKILVTFDLNDEGILYVTAKIISTGQVFDTSIYLQKSGLNSIELKNLIKKGV